MSESKTHIPWLSSYGDVPFHLHYPTGTMCDAVLEAARQYPENSALSYMGMNVDYRTLAERIDTVARAFAAQGVTSGQRVVLCMPNIPQTVYCLYALNRIGAIAVMIHPLSAEEEIAFYLNEVEADFLITLDQFYEKVASVQKTVPLRRLLITGAADTLGAFKRNAYKLTAGRSIPPVPKLPHITFWQGFLESGESYSGSYIDADKKGDDPAVILFSGGTTGVTKGILLSNLNFNALALQTAAMCHCTVTGHSMLAAMPMFHGFGLGVCVHTMLVAGGQSILVPRFNVKEYAGLIRKKRPNFIAGVPTLYEALTRDASLDGVKLDFLMGVFSGGDSLSTALKKKFDAFLLQHGAHVRIREGYGTTECVTASCLTPYNQERVGSIGLPYPDTYYKICWLHSTEEVPYGMEGEICLRGPSVMLGYLNHPEETAKTLQKHEDGHIWLHTGDLGLMDADGFIYFRQRIKRMIVTSGYNVYPSQLENIIDGHPAVQMSCVIGVKDPYKMQKVKAFVVLRPGNLPSDKLKKELLAYCEKRIAKYAMPYDIEFRENLPKTKVGKIAYTVLEQEEVAKVAAG